MQVSAASMHGGVYTHLADQLLLVIDNLLAESSSTNAVHMELHAPLETATASSGELAEVYGQLFGPSICQSIAVEGSDAIPDDRNDPATAQGTALDVTEPKNVVGSEGQQAASQPSSSPSSELSTHSKDKDTSSTPSKSGDAPQSSPGKDAYRPGTAAPPARSHSEITANIDPSVKAAQASHIVLILPGMVCASIGFQQLSLPHL